MLLKESIQAILDYTKEIDFSFFVKDRKTQMAVIKEFEIIGEAVTKIPAEKKNGIKMLYFNSLVFRR